MTRYQDFENIHIRPNEAVPPRTLKDYSFAFGFEAGELAGKRVLDLGAHKEETFSKELADQKIEGEVVSFSPDFAKSEGRLSNPENKKRNSVAGLAEKLPFADNSFDFIFDLGGPSLYSTELDDIKARLAEEIRILK